MAVRLGEFVVYGELYNTHHYATTGLIVLRGRTQDEETIIRLDLTGNCGPDLRGKHVRFYHDEDAADAEPYDPDVHGELNHDQIGPTGEISVEGWSRVLPCSVKEYLRRSDLGEPPPTEWKRRVYLEWYSQNGRVCFEIPGVRVEECVREPDSDDEHDEGDWRELPNATPRPPAETPAPQGAPGITMIQQDEDGTRIGPWEGTTGVEQRSESISPELQQYLDRETDAVEQAIHGGDPMAFGDDTEDLELMDYCIEHGTPKSLEELLDHPGDMPPAELLNEEEVETQLKILLARLALINVSLAVCKHYTPRRAYALLRNRLLQEATNYTELLGTVWIQHLMTHEYCEDCDAAWEDGNPSN